MNNATKPLFQQCNKQMKRAYFIMFKPIQLKSDIQGILIRNAMKGDLDV